MLCISSYYLWVCLILWSVHLLFPWLETNKKQTCQLHSVSFQNLFTHWSTEWVSSVCVQTALCWSVVKKDFGRTLSAAGSFPSFDFQFLAEHHYFFFFTFELVCSCCLLDHYLDHEVVKVKTKFKKKKINSHQWPCFNFIFSAKWLVWSTITVILRKSGHTIFTRIAYACFVMFVYCKKKKVLFCANVMCYFY